MDFCADDPSAVSDADGYPCPPPIDCTPYCDDSAEDVCPDQPDDISCYIVGCCEWDIDEEECNSTIGDLECKQGSNGCGASGGLKDD